jgi:voltage-gated potassium channel
MLVAALLVIPALLIEESNVGELWDTVAVALNWLTWSAFLVEVVVMLSLVPVKVDWLRKHPLDVAIVVLTPPFLPPTLQAIRALRLLRLLRLLKAVQLIRRLFSLEGLKYAAVLALVTVLGGGTAFSVVEKEQDMTIWDGVWWAITTVTTVGYGDISPKSSAGRTIAIGVMVVGIGFIALLTAAAAQRFIAPQIREEVAEAEQDIATPERQEMMRELNKIASRLDAIEASVRELETKSRNRS